MPTPDFFDRMLTVMQNFGVPVLVIIATGWAFWRITVWFGKEIIIPIRNSLCARFVAFMDRLEGVLEQTISSLGKVEISLATIDATLKRIELHKSTIEASVMRLEQRKNAIDEHHQKIESVLSRIESRQSEIEKTDATILKMRPVSKSTGESS